MSTYFPFGVSPSSVTNISYSVTAVTASVALPNISATTALFAAVVVTPPASGVAGADASCSPALAPAGATGATGATGAAGANLLSACPPGTKECPVGVTAAGYMRVCIEYGACSPAQFNCPSGSYLY
jgi:hypothetical protein